MNQIAGSAQSKAEFTLPVPMGSPQNYYGVGDFTKNTITTTTTQTQANQRISAATVPSGSWTTPANAYGAGVASSTTTNGAVQQWGGFAFSSLPNDPTLVIEAITLRLDGADLNGSGTVTSCQLKTDLSWGAGVAGTWSSIQNSPDLSISPINVAVGSTTTMTSWGAHAWTYSNLSSTNFRVRLTWVNGPLGTSPCPNTRYLDLDEVDVQVYWHTDTTTTTTTQSTGTVSNPAGGTLTSQGFWGAVITKGGSRENGDEFSPQNDNAGISGHTSSNPEYTTDGYDYAVILPGGNGQVRIYDATFCETGSNGSGGNMGAGDHWIGGSPNGVTTLYTLWNENGTPYNTGDDTLVASSGNPFANEIQADYSGAMGTPGHSGLTDCSANTYHNAWYTLANGLAAGRYRMNVNTSSANNNSTNAENMWSAWVSSSGSNPQVYGEAKMAAYNNLPAGTQLFYLAQIDASNAGKTMEISLFDPGDVSGDAYLQDQVAGRQRLQLRHVLLDGRRRHLRQQRDPDPDRLRGRQLLQRPRHHHRRGAPEHVRVDGPDAGRRDPGRLVEDRVPGQRRQRHHHLAGRHQGQPGPPGPVAAGRVAALDLGGSDDARRTRSRQGPRPGRPGVAALRADDLRPHRVGGRGHGRFVVLGQPAKMQRAADAGAFAGAVFLPGDPERCRWWPPVLPRHATAIRTVALAASP